MGNRAGRQGRIGLGVTVISIHVQKKWIKMNLINTNREMVSINMFQSRKLFDIHVVRCKVF